VLDDQQRRRIDFQRSDIRWVTRKEKSHGAFRLEAVLRLQPANSAAPTLFALGAAVLAGNMYGDDGLVKDPPYMFQLAAGTADHVIFRTAMTHGSVGSVNESRGSVSADGATDTFGSNNEIFDRVEVNLDLEPARMLSGYDEIAECYEQRAKFTGLITIEHPAGGTSELEFPVTHLNLLPSRAMWQLETGPVLFLKKDHALPSAGELLADLVPCFVHANRSDSAEFSPNFPFARERSSRVASAGARIISCRVQLLANGN
jgi:hypothetical protein